MEMLAPQFLQPPRLTHSPRRCRPSPCPLQQRKLVRNLAATSALACSQISANPLEYLCASKRRRANPTTLALPSKVANNASTQRIVAWGACPERFLQNILERCPRDSTIVYLLVRSTELPYIVFYVPPFCFQGSSQPHRICTGLVLIEMSSDPLPKCRSSLAIAADRVLRYSKKAPTQAPLFLRAKILPLACLSRLKVCHRGPLTPLTVRTASPCKGRNSTKSGSYDGGRGRVAGALPLPLGLLFGVPPAWSRWQDPLPGPLRML